MKSATINFEGPEKKLEVILSSPQAGLRSNKKEQWDRVVKASDAEVISKISAKHLDAYLLSESSLFVWEDRILMITCGKTTLVRAIPEILKIVKKEKVAFVFYERQSFMFPQEQPSNFEDDVEAIVKYFPGKSYRLGPANYDHVHVFYSSHTHASPDQDATLEVLMHDLKDTVIDIFLFNHGRSEDEIDDLSGLNRIYPRMKKDRHLFSPFGYSVNGIYKKNYFTVHVTPQPEGSYASFETNVIEDNYSERINQVVSIFSPRQFSLVLTTSMVDRCRSLHSTMLDVVPGYIASEKSLYEFDCGYAVTFLNYLRR